MKQNILRQLKEIQYQADRVIKQESTLIDIKNFEKNSIKLQHFLSEKIEHDGVEALMKEIPTDLVKVNLEIRSGLLQSLVPMAVWEWWQEKNTRDNALAKVKTARGKFVAIESILIEYLN